MPDEDEQYWRETYKTRPYVRGDQTYEDLAPAYRAGYSASSNLENENESFEGVEDRVRKNLENDQSCSIDWDQAREAAKDAFDRTVQLREERLRPSKERVDAGEVVLRKEVVIESETFEVPVEREEVIIERRAASRTGQTGEISEGEAEEVARIPVKEERVKLEKETVPTEEVRLKKQTVSDTQRVSGTKRREDIKVDKSGSPNIREDRSDRSDSDERSRPGPHR